MKRFVAHAALAALLAGLGGASALADSVELQMLKQQIKELEAKGAKVPPMLYQMVADAEKDEARKGRKSDTDNAYGKSVAQMSCLDDVSGTYKSSSGDQTVILNKGGSGSFQQYATNRTYRSDVKFNWRGAKDSMTFTYTSDLVFTYTKSGKVEHRAKPKGGAVHCAYYGKSIDIGHVMYYRN